MPTHKGATVTDALTTYGAWLDQQPLAPKTRRAYLLHVGHFCDYLTTYPPTYGDPLRDPHARDYAVRDFKTYLKTERHAKPTTVNLALAALDHFYQHFLDAGRPNVEREDLPHLAPRALDADAQKRFLRAVQREPSARDRALALLLFYTGLRIGECVALDLADVPQSARLSHVIVRHGKGDSYREVPLNSHAHAALKAWRTERERLFGHSDETALFLNRQGRRLSLRATDLVVRRIGHSAGLTLSAHVLRHTCLTNLVRKGNDIVLVAEIAGHKHLDTTRRYSLPTHAERAAAMEGITVAY